LRTKTHLHRELAHQRRGRGQPAHQDKAAANSTIFLACRPRATAPADGETQYWEDVEPMVAQVVRLRVTESPKIAKKAVDGLSGFLKSRSKLVESPFHRETKLGRRRSGPGPENQIPKCKCPMSNSTFNVSSFMPIETKLVLINSSQVDVSFSSAFATSISVQLRSEEGEAFFDRKTTSTDGQNEPRLSFTGFPPDQNLLCTITVEGESGSSNDVRVSIDW
jgi:hypothetical protein